MKKIITVTLLMYSLHLFIVIIISAIHLSCWILGVEELIGGTYIQFLKSFYYEGHLGEAKAYRVHLFYFIICIIMGFMINGSKAASWD